MDIRVRFAGNRDFDETDHFANLHRPIVPPPGVMYLVDGVLERSLDFPGTGGVKKVILPS